MSNHQRYKEWLLLSMYDELTTSERELLDKHLSQCTGCQQELVELKHFHATLSQAGALAPSEELLREAREELRASIRTERARVPLRNRISELASDFLIPHYKIAVGGVLTLAVGVLVGRLYFSPTPATLAHNGQDAKFTTSFESEPRIANIRFIDSDASDGEVEFTFDAISPVHIKGSINDERVQKVLANALVNDQNPGVRLRSVSALATQTENLKRPDKEVKAALIRAVKTDDNPGVRKEALRTLLSFPFDNEIKQAFLYVLTKDKNPAMRITAINSLDSARSQSNHADNDLLEVLKQRMQSDENNYVRIRAKAVLEEVKQQ